MEAHDQRITRPVVVGQRCLKWDQDTRALGASPSLSTSTASHSPLAKTIARKGVHVRALHLLYTEAGEESDDCGHFRDEKLRLRVLCKSQGHTAG